MTQQQNADIQKYITSLAYPCSREDLVAHARISGANEDVVQTIQGLPYDFFTSPYDVREAMYE